MSLCSHRPRQRVLKQRLPKNINVNIRMHGFQSSASRTTMYTHSYASLYDRFGALRTNAWTLNALKVKPHQTLTKLVGLGSDVWVASLLSTDVPTV